MDVRCQSIWAYSNLHSMVLGIQMPTCRDLQLYPHIQSINATGSQEIKCQLTGTYNCILTYNQTKQHMIIGKQMPTCRDLQLHPHINQTNASSKENDEWPMKWSYTHFHIIGTMAKGMVLQLSSMGKQKRYVTKTNEMIMH